jgi:SOS response regulatory protein OraA/RecX
MNDNPVLKYFLNLLKVRDYSKKALIEKAKIRGYLDDQIQESLDYLLEKGFLDDYRLAKNLIEKYKGIKGPFWIKQKLNLKGIEKETIEKVWQESNLDLIKPSQKLKEKIENKYKIKFTDWQFLESKTKNKIYNYFQTKGYSNILEILKQWQSD